MIAQYLYSLVFVAWLSPAERERLETIRAARSLAFNIWLLGGPDLRGLPDDELIELLIEGMKEMRSVVRESGLSADEAATAMQELGRAMRGSDGDTGG